MNATGLKVTVMGTKFNLKAVRKDPEAVLYLKSGLVSLLSEKSGKNAIVHPVRRLCSITVTDTSALANRPE